MPGYMVSDSVNLFAIIGLDRAKFELEAINKIHIVDYTNTTAYIKGEQGNIALKIPASIALDGEEFKANLADETLEIDDIR